MSNLDPATARQQLEQRFLRSVLSAGHIAELSDEEVLAYLAGADMGRPRTAADRAAAGPLNQGKPERPAVLKVYNNEGGPILTVQIMGQPSMPQPDWLKMTRADGTTFFFRLPPFAREVVVEPDPGGGPEVGRS